MLCEIVGTWSWDTESNRISLEPALAPYFNVSKAEAVAGVTIERCLDAIHPDDRENVRNIAAKAHLSAGGYYQDYRVVSPALGTRRLLDIGKLTSDQPPNYFGMIIDASKIQLSKNDAHRSIEAHVTEAQKINESLGTPTIGYFFEAIMHEIRSLKHNSH